MRQQLGSAAPGKWHPDFVFVATPRSLLELCPDVALWDSDAAKAAFARMAENRIVVDGDSGAQIAAAARDNCVTVGFVARA